MEDLVLAKAGVDFFEEVFKLVYAKLYDECQATRGGKAKRYLESTPSWLSWLGWMVRPLVVLAPFDPSRCGVARFGFESGPF